MCEESSIMARIKVGIVGTGFIAPVHVEALRRISHLVEVVALAGVSQEDAEKVGRELGISYCTGDYRNLLKDPDIDSLHICTPNYLHYTMVKEAIEFGKHVMCEKPLALNFFEARDLVRLATHKNLHVGVNHNLRYYPMVEEMRALFEKGSVGNLFSLNGVYFQDWLAKDTDYSWRLESSQSGRSRAVADIGTHWFDMIQHITGVKIASVFAQLGVMYPTRKKPSLGDNLTFSVEEHDASSYVEYHVDTEDYASILFKTDNGVIGNLSVSQVASGFKNYLELRLIGDQGSFMWDSESPNRLFRGYRDKSNEITMKDPMLLEPSARAMSSFPGGHQEGYGDTFKYLFKDFYSSIQSQSEHTSLNPLYPTFEDGSKELALCDAIMESAEKAHWVEVVYE